MDIINEMAIDAQTDPYFLELYEKLEKSYFINFLYKENIFNMTAKEVQDILSFADILSLSDNESYKNQSIKIISLLSDFLSKDPLYIHFARGIMLRLGNFPSYNLLNKVFSKNEKCVGESVNIGVERIIKETTNKDPNSKKIFTDSQKKVFDKLLNKNHFSFSGPTSFGKSFLLNSFINYIMNESKSGVNIAYIVPTRALVSQTKKMLKEIVGDNANYILSSSPAIPTCLSTKNKKFIFVFTPERLVEYFSNSNNPALQYVFVDEAQKILMIDSRAAIYYHALSMAERKSCNLFFSSPNINNSDIFLSIFDKSTEESLHIEESPVCQNRCFVDILNNKVKYFSELDNVVELDYKFSNNVVDLIKDISKSNDCYHKSIVYCNTISDTIDLAVDLAESLPVKDDDLLNDAANEIANYVHEDYFLVDCIKKGVAFHFGKLPQKVREIVENLYSDGTVDFMFCTSTLLEGVNLPAQNIFVLSNKIGNNKINSIDFWNLAGRAGRLAKDLYGNVICVRWSNIDGRWTKDKDLNILLNKKIEDIDYYLLDGKNNFYKNIKQSLIGKPFTSQSATAKQKEIWNSFANILRIQNGMGESSLLKDKFINKIPESIDLLSKIKKSNVVPYKIMNKSPLLKAKYQEKIYTLENPFLLSTPTYDNCLQMLEFLYNTYNWLEEESCGNNPLISLNNDNPQKVLSHYAYLMSEWMTGTTINILIKSSIKNHTNKKIKVGFGQYEFFNPNNKSHVNILINEVMDDIDRKLRFKLKDYFENYYNILVELGFLDCENWALYLEHGTTNKKYIELQELGIPRYLVEKFYKKCKDYLFFENDLLIRVDFQKIKELLKDSTDVDDIEIIKILNDNNLE